MDRDFIERALRLARGGYADGGDTDIQSNSMPVISDGQVNWGDSSNAADFVRADQAMRAMRSAPAAPEPQSAPMPMQRSAPAPAPTAPPAPSTDELLALFSNPTKSVASAAIDQAAPVAKFTDRAAPGISMTPQQRDLIIRTIAAESSGKTPEEGQGIAHVIMNRIMSGRYGKTPESVLFAPKQFEPWADPRGSNYPMRHKPGMAKYEKAQAALDAAMGGDDITGGATLFWGPKSQAALGRPAPKWGRTGGLDIGETRFHREEGGEVSEGNDMDSYAARALYLARGGYATPGFVDDQPDEEYSDGARPLTIYRNPSRAAPAGAMDVGGDQGPSYDQMGNITSPGRNADPAVDASEWDRLPLFANQPPPASVLEQAKRYILSNQIDELAHWRQGDQIGLSASGPNGTVFDQKMVSPEELPALVGQELSKKILNGEGSARSISGFPEEAGVNFISGDGLAVGGEGMKSYYDQILPKRFQELARKHDKGAKIEANDLITKPGNKVADEAALSENSQLIEQSRFWDDARGENVNGYRVTSPGGQELGVFEDLPDAHSALLQVLGDAKEPDTILKTQSLTITPQMRESILRGQHAYAVGGSVVDRALMLLSKQGR